MMKSIITNPEIKIVKGIHPDFRARNSYGFARDTYTYHYGKSAVRLSTYRKEGIRFNDAINASELFIKTEYNLYCLEGNLFADIKRFDSRKEAEAWLEPKLLEWEDNRNGR